jgi:hypothetical protein
MVWDLINELVAIKRIRVPLTYPMQITQSLDESLDGEMR